MGEGPGATAGTDHEDGGADAVDLVSVLGALTLEPTGATDVPPQAGLEEDDGDGTGP